MDYEAFRLQEVEDGIFGYCAECGRSLTEDELVVCDSCEDELRGECIL